MSLVANPSIVSRYAATLWLLCACVLAMVSSAPAAATSAVPAYESFNDTMTMSVGRSGPAVAAAKASPQDLFDDDPPSFVLAVYTWLFANQPAATPALPYQLTPYYSYCLRWYHSRAPPALL